MATYSMKRGGKEVGPASVYAKPHTMTGGKVALGNGYQAEPRSRADSVNMSVGNIDREGYNPAPKTSGITIRGCGAATKGTKARGPMA